MDNAANKVLESSVHRTLHANSFSRASTQATFVLTDLLSRYIQLLTSTCAKYSQHAGRSNISIRDVLGALGDLGVSVDELGEFFSLEGKDLARYAVYTPRRTEDLNEFKVQLFEGCCQDRDDYTPLEYLRVPTPLLEEEELEHDAEDDAMNVDDGDSVLASNLEDAELPMDGIEPLLPNGAPPRELLPWNTTPPLPLSSISSPSSPSRKRPRTLNWQPPDHVPIFLPPFPTTQPPPSPPPQQSPRPHQAEPSFAHVEGTKLDKPPIALSQSLTSTSTDYLAQVPYSQSSLASVPEWHLPTPPPPVPPRKQAQLSLPLTEPSLFAAYHHILTHPPPVEPPPASLARHKVAMALLVQAQATTRWDPPDTIFSGAAPCLPRVATVGPSYPVPVSEVKGEGKEKEKEKEFKFPQTNSRPVSSLERLSPSISQQSSRIPELARHILPPTILARTSRLTHPPILYRGNKALVYGNGVPAPWNSTFGSTAAPDAVPSTPVGKDAGPLTNGKSKEATAKPLIPDARLYATWDYEPKDYRVPLPASHRNRSRMGSIQSGSNAAGGSTTISLTLGGRGRSGSKFS